MKTIIKFTYFISQFDENDRFRGIFNGPTSVLLNIKLKLSTDFNDVKKTISSKSEIGSKNVFFKNGQ